MTALQSGAGAAVLCFGWGTEAQGQEFRIPITLLSQGPQDSQERSPDEPLHVPVGALCRRRLLLGVSSVFQLAASGLPDHWLPSA